MSSLAIMRGSRNEINNAPIVNGQIFIETDQVGTEYNKIYIDNNNERTVLGIDNWNDIINKPFETVGDSLSITNGTLSIKTDWSELTDKPFEEIGYGVSVDDDGNLVTNINFIECGWNIDSLNESASQYITVNNNSTLIHGSIYIEKSLFFTDSENNICVFESEDIDENSFIEVYTSVWNFYPKKIIIKNNKCKIIFPPYDGIITCRIYIK